jgi:hypothetical protein
LAPHGLVGGMQTTAHIYLLWHCGCPLFVIGYALTKDENPSRRYSPRAVRSAIGRSVALTAAGAAAATAFSMSEAVLPRIMLDEYRFVPEWLYVVAAPVASLCIVAIVVLWLRRRSILDLFLMVVLCAYLIEIPPHYFPFPARFSTGWYAVRVTSGAHPVSRRTRGCVLTYRPRARRRSFVCPYWALDVKGQVDARHARFTAHVPVRGRFENTRGGGAS